MKWIFVGSLGTGERVYYRQDNHGLAVEKDHQHLVDPTPEEKEEIMRTMSHVRHWVKEVES